jgi:hypothetical protein
MDGWAPFDLLLVELYSRGVMNALFGFEYNELESGLKLRDDLLCM